MQNAYMVTMTSFYNILIYNNIYKKHNYRGNSSTKFICKIKEAQV